jgi:hypothetical protein
LSALHLLGELAQPALKLVGIAEQSSESTSFHDPNGNPWNDPASYTGV